MKSRLSKLAFLAAIGVVALTGIQAKSGNSMFVQEVEPELEIENWMVDDSFWDKATTSLDPATEKSLAIEAWMTDDNYWN